MVDQRSITSAKQENCHLDAPIVATGENQAPIVGEQRVRGRSLQVLVGS